MSDFGLFLLLFAALALMIGIIRGLAWLTDFVEAGGVRGAMQRSKDRYTVNRAVDNNVTVMSRQPIDSAPSMPSAAIRQTAPQTPDRRTMFVPTPAEMLDIFRVLRAAGIKREMITGPWRAAGLPLDNNLWTQAAPADDDTHITPIAQRPTRAQFESDPELVYQPPH